MVSLTSSIVTHRSCLKLKLVHDELVRALCRVVCWKSFRSRCVLDRDGLMADVLLPQSSVAMNV